MQSLQIDNKIGGGPLDYTRYYMEAESFFEHTNNQASQYTITLQDLAEEVFVVPTRGSYVTFFDSRWESRDEGVPDGILWTGYVVDEPSPVFLGTRAGAKVWKYTLIVTSEDYLPQVKELPVKTYVNKTRGYIIRDIIAQMFKDADVVPLDVTGVKDGGLERLFQTERTKKFADLLADFAKADGYCYRVIDSKLFYQPEAEFMPASSDPLLKLVIDEEDPRYSPWSMGLTRVATSIVNDITVFGEDEPTTLVNERYVSDGYMGEFQLLFKPFGVVEKVLVQDDFTAPSFDTSLWEEVDDPLALTGLGDGSYMQLFEGSLNLVGGPTAGPPYNPADFNAPQVYLRARRGIELSGIIDFRDGEIAFPPSPTGAALLGSLNSDEAMGFDSCLSAWVIDCADNSLGPVVGGVGVGQRFYFNVNYAYILRRRFEFDIPVGNPVIRRGPLETDIVFGDVIKTNGCWITYYVEEQNTTDPQNVIIKKFTIYSGRHENVPEFVLYAPVVQYNLHAVLNFVKVMRPQQVRVEVNGMPQKLGDFIDDGVGTIVVEDNKAKLAWYSIPTSTDPPTDIVVTAGNPFAFWKMGDSGSFVADSATGAYSMLSDPGVTLVPSAPSGTTDQARHFPGAPSAVRGPADGVTFFAGGFPVPFSITGWIRTSEANGGIFCKLSAYSGYVSLRVNNGRLQSLLENPDAAVSGATAINDGAWHHFAWTHDAVIFSPGSTQLYIDGVLDGGGTQAIYTPQISSAWALGYDHCYLPALGFFQDAYLTGDLDEVVIWDFAMDPTQVDGQFKAAQAGAEPTTPAYNPQTGVTIPPQGSIVDITYYRAEQAKCRVRSLTSIAAERARFGDDGIRQATILAGEVFPTPRTSEECQYLAQAFLADREGFRYEGTYEFQTGERDITNLTIFPAPGDLIPTDITLANGERIDTNMLCTGVSSQFLAESAYSIRLDFGPRSRFDDAQRKLLLARKSSLDNIEIRDKDILVAEILNSTGYAIPADPTDVLVTQVTVLTFTVNMNPTRILTPTGYGSGGGVEVNATLPDGVVGYEIRRDDTGWGQPNYVARVAAATFTLNRGTRDRAYFVRPYNNQSNYSRHSALVRVISPLSNTLVATGLDGDINQTGDIRLFIPLTRNPDIGGFLVQKDNSDGVVIYLGDGIMHRTILSGADVLVESNRITLSFLNQTAATSFTVRVLVYNLVGEYGPETFFTITRPAVLT